MRSLRYKQRLLYISYTSALTFKYFHCHLLSPFLGLQLNELAINIHLLKFLSFIYRPIHYLTEILIQM